MLKKFLASCLFLLLIISMTISCSAVKAPESNLVPGKANLVVQLQVGRILSDPVLQVAYNELAKMNPAWPQTANDTVNQLLQKTGFDLSTITSSVFFADIESTSQTQNTYAGIIATGTFKESDLITNIKRQTQLTLNTSDYKGLTIYTAAPDNFEIVFLNQSQVVFGMSKAVRDVVDVNNKDQQPLSGTTINTLNRFGSSLIVGAFIPPENLRNELGNKGPPQGSLLTTSFQDIDTIGFAVDQPGLNLSVSIDTHFSNTTSVQDAKDEITGLISIAKGTSQDQNVKAALDNIKVSTTDSWLSMHYSANPADIAALISSFQTQK